MWPGLAGNNVARQSTESYSHPDTLSAAQNGQAAESFSTLVGFKPMSSATLQLDLTTKPHVCIHQRKTVEVATESFITLFQSSKLANLN